MPMIVDSRSDVIHLQNDLQGHCYDMEYAIGYEICLPNAVLYLLDSNDKHF